MVPGYSMNSQITTDTSTSWNGASTTTTQTGAPPLLLPDPSGWSQISRASRSCTVLQPLNNYIKSYSGVSTWLQVFQESLGNLQSPTRFSTKFEFISPPCIVISINDACSVFCLCGFLVLCFSCTHSRLWCRNILQPGFLLYCEVNNIKQKCSTCIRFAKITGSQTAHTRNTSQKHLHRVFCRSTVVLG